MRSDNKNETMKLMRFFAHPAVIPSVIVVFDIAIFFIVTYAVNIAMKLPALIKSAGLFDKDVKPQIDMGLSNLQPHPFSGGIVSFVYLVMLIALIIFDIRMAYKMRASFSEKDINKGHAGTSRWTTRRELKKQYKKVPLKDEFYDGTGGTIISRIKDHLYIDDSPSNTLVTGTTRSGKGEMYVFPTIDVYSRAKLLKDRPSMIVNDPKLELYRSCKALLESRGYIVRLFNLDDPIHSMGYNPLQLVIDYYKAGQLERAQMAAKTFAFSIFHADDNNQEPIWKNTATDLFTALIVAVTTDCLEADKELNERRSMLFSEKRQNFELLDEDAKDEAKARYENMKKKLKDPILSDEVKYIPEGESFEPSYENEKMVNCFSVINFFKEMCDRAAEQSEDTESFEKMAETALDEYFNMRPKLDYAASLYNEIKNAGDRTKGSVYINMQSAVSTFALDNIARMTAENNISIEDLGYGDRPIAVFMGIPSEDRSNHFLATTFIAQVYQYLFRLSKQTGGKLERKLKFILDEFGNLPPIENFAGFVTVCLGLGISFDIYIQSYNQIAAKYGDEKGTILENFANQIYIKSVGNESAQEFSGMLGNKTVIDVQRSGARGSIDKSYMESTKERPLMFPDELTRLKEGECVIYRGIKRQDRLGIAVDSYPIINEHKVRLGIFAFLSCVYGFLKGKDAERYSYHPTEKRQTTRDEAWQMRIGFARMYFGTALLYRWQYLKGTFPDPDTILFKDICDEDRSHVTFDGRVYDPDEVIEKIQAEKAESMKAKAGNLMKGLLSAVDKELGRQLIKPAAEKKEKQAISDNSLKKVRETLSKIMGEDYMERLALSEDSSFDEYMQTIEKTDLINEKIKKTILGVMRKGGGER